MVLASCAGVALGKVVEHGYELAAELAVRVAAAAKAPAKAAA